MASMQLCKPSYGYGATSQNSSSYQHHEEYQMKKSSSISSSSSSHASHGYYGQAQGSQMGLSMHALDDGELGHAWGDNSSHYYALAQSVLPSPSVHVQQASHAETMKRQESHVAQRAGKPGIYSSPARTSYSNGTTSRDIGNMVGKMDQGWANKPAPCSSPIGANQYGQSMFKEQENGYNYNKGSAGSGWAGKPTNYAGGNQMNHSAQSMHKQQQQHMMGKMDHGYVSSPRANHSSHAMHKDEHLMGEMDHGLISSLTGANHHGFAMHDDEHLDHGLIHSPSRANQSSFGMHKDEHMMSKMDHGVLSSPRANHSSLAMHKEDHMMGKMGHGSAMKPTQYPSPVPASHYGSPTYKGQGEKAYNYTDRGIEGSWANKSGPTHLSHSSNGMYNKQGQHGWAGKAGNSFGSAQINNSANAMHEHHDYGNEDIDDIMDEILNKYPAHNVNNGHRGLAAMSGGASINQKQASYAEQEAYAESAHHQSAQSMAWNERKEKKEAYVANSNRGMYSAASGANKFEMNNRGICDNGITGYDDEYDD